MVLSGTLAGVVIAASAILLVGWLRRESSGFTPQASATAGDPADAPAAPQLAMRLVVIYQRAQTDSLRLASVEAPIVWMPNVTDRAVQIVRLTLEGFPDDRRTVPPAGPGIRCRGVFVDERGGAWVDLEGSTLAAVHGADEEESLVATISRSLVDTLQEVRHVGFLIDGEPRDTLAGHVDLTRRFDGHEWPLDSDPAGAAGTNGTIATLHAQ